MEGRNFPSYLKTAFRQFFWGGGRGAGSGVLKTQVCYIEKSPHESESIRQPTSES